MNFCIVIIGPPGSGKTSLADAVAERLNLPLISSGQIARDFADSDAGVARELHNGDWAPELAMRTEVLARVEDAVVTVGGFVIEGFPRRLEQLYLLESVPHLQPLYFLLECDPLICLRRLILRGRPGDHADAVALRWRAWEEETQQMTSLIYDHLLELSSLAPVEDLVENIVQVYERQLDLA